MGFMENPCAPSWLGIKLRHAKRKFVHILCRNFFYIIFVVDNSALGRHQWPIVVQGSFAMEKARAAYLGLKFVKPVFGLAVVRSCAVWEIKLVLWLSLGVCPVWHSCGNLWEISWRLPGPSLGVPPCWENYEPGFLWLGGAWLTCNQLPC